MRLTLEPVDRLHADCMATAERINRRAALGAAFIAEWEPAPLDPTWTPPPTEVASRLPRRPVAVVPDVLLMRSIDIPYLDEVPRLRGWFR